MRVRIVSKPTTHCIDGIQLHHFRPGVEYELGSGLAELMIVEGWAQPVVSSASAAERRTVANASTPEGRPERRTNLIRLGRPSWH